MHVSKMMQQQAATHEWLCPKYMYFYMCANVALTKSGLFHFEILNFSCSVLSDEALRSGRAAPAEADRDPLKARPLDVCITSGQGSRTFSLSRPLNNNNNSLSERILERKKMADISGPAMSYSSMKGRLHDGLLKGLEVMGYE